MSGSLNKVCLIGNLGRDPEGRDTNNGSHVVNFPLAVTERWKDKDGNPRESTEWARIVIFNEGIGGIAERFLKKGSRVYVEGKMQTRKWQGQDGQDRYTTEVVLQRFDSKMVLLDRAEKGDAHEPQGQQAASDLDDDIPF